MEVKKLFEREMRNKKKKGRRKRVKVKSEEGGSYEDGEKCDRVGNYDYGG